MTTTIERLPRMWFTSGHGELWNCDGTYCRVPYDLLPNVSDVSPDFEWLDDFPNGYWDCTLGSGDNNIEHFEQIVATINDHHLTLPAEFVRFLGSRALQTKVPTCTGCYLELSDSLIELPWDEPSYALRFMNDSQSCVLWYLILKKDMATKIVASPYFLDREIFDVMNDEEQPMEYGDVFAHVSVCSLSFLEFIYRFWIENVIWFLNHDKRQLPNRAINYVRQITKKA